MLIIVQKNHLMNNNTANSFYLNYCRVTLKGLDVFENVEVKTFISGTLPTVPHGSKIEIDPFTEEYTRVKPGELILIKKKNTF